jgi:hypothetical protein
MGVVTRRYEAMNKVAAEGSKSKGKHNRILPTIFRISKNEEILVIE